MAVFDNSHSFFYQESVRNLKNKVEQLLTVTPPGDQKTIPLQKACSSLEYLIKISESNENQGSETPETSVTTMSQTY